MVVEARGGTSHRLLWTNCWREQADNRPETDLEPDHRRGHLAIRTSTARRPADRKSDREILNERYARDEIDRDELEQKRKDLSE
jgi:hypothetical protein